MQADQLLQPVLFIHLPAGVEGLAHAVGVEHQAIAGAQLFCPLIEVEREHAQRQSARRGAGGDLAVRAPQQRLSLFRCLPYLSLVRLSVPVTRAEDAMPVRITLLHAMAGSLA